MNYNLGANKNPFYIIFGLIAFFVAALLLFKPVLKWFYPVKYMEEIKKYSNEYRLDEHLVMAVISTESKFDEDAVSGKDAKGLMQLKEETALWCMEQFRIDGNEADLYNPDLNIHIGCAYMRYLIDKFNFNTNTALAAYNAGEGNVTKWLDNQGAQSRLELIPFAETRKYVDTVNKRIKIYHFLY